MPDHGILPSQSQPTPELDFIMPASFTPLVHPAWPAEVVSFTHSPRPARAAPMQLFTSAPDQYTTLEQPAPAAGFTAPAQIADPPASESPANYAGADSSNNSISTSHQLWIRQQPEKSRVVVKGREKGQ